MAQSGAADLVPPFIFNALRSFIGAFALYLFWILINQREKKPFFPTDKPDRKRYYMSGLICGLCLAVSVNFQQFGIAFYPKGVASEARAGFLTALYVILVPVFSVFAKKKIHPVIWVAVIIALFGVYKLCFSGGLEQIYLGDVLVFLCAICFSLHIMAVDKFVWLTGGIKLSIMQFIICGTSSLVLSLIFELPQINIQNILSATPQILYLGIMSSGVAYTLQIVGQKYAEAAVASISMSLESVFAALGGWIISGNVLSVSEILGCVLVFLAIIIAQTPEIFSKKTT